MWTLCLSGWGQPHDALSGIAPDATHLEYAHHASVEEALAAIAAAARSHEMVIGWSLGGQLAVRAVASGMMRPERLVLIAVPFQFVRGANGLGMPRDTYRKFRSNYASDPKRTLAKAWELIAYEDTRNEQVRSQLARHDAQAVLSKDWLRWLDWLEAFSCEPLPFDRFPPTLLVHGDRDAVVFHEQSRHFVKRLPRAELAIWEGCGHAPHWHDGQALLALIKEYAHV